MVNGWLTRHSRAALIVIGGLTLLTAGCSSSNTTGIGVSNVTRVRTIDTVPNGGNASISINNGTVAGAQTFFSGSDYRFIQPGSATLTFMLDVNTTTYSSIPVTFNGASTYSVILYGRADVTDPADPRYPSQGTTTDNQSATASGTADLQVIIAAPDAPNVDVTVNGAVLASNVAYKANIPYANYPAGNLIVAITRHSNGAPLASATIAAGSGHSLSAYFVEPTVKTDVAAPTYAVDSLTDF